MYSSRPEAESCGPSRLFARWIVQARTTARAYAIDTRPRVDASDYVRANRSNSWHVADIDQIGIAYFWLIKNEPLLWKNYVSYVDVELYSIVFDHGQTDQLSGEPVRVMNLVRVSVQWKLVIEHVLYLMLWK